VLRYIVQRLVVFAITLLGVAVVVSALLRLVPGDPAVVFLGENATPQAVAELRRSLGLDVPWPAQLLRYLSGIPTGTWGGRSSSGNRSRSSSPKGSRPLWSSLSRRS